MKTSRAARRAIALFIALAMIATACGGDDNEDKADDTTETTAPAEQKDPIKIGTSIWANPAIGLNTRFAGIGAAVEAINAAGGINGHPIEWVKCEASDDPNEGDACARKMVDEGVVATVNDSLLLSEASSTEILLQAGIPQIDPFISSPDTYSKENVFMLQPGSPPQYAAVVQGIADQGYKSIYLLISASASAVLNEQTIREAAEFYGLEVKGKTEVPNQAADYSPFVAAAADSGADVTVPVLSPIGTNLLLQTATQLGEDLRIGIGEGQFKESSYEQFGAGALDGAILADVIPPVAAASDYPVMQQAIDEIDAYFEETGDELAAPENLSTIITRAWFGVQAFKQIAETLGDDITAEAMMSALKTIKDVDLGVLTWTPSATGPTPFESASNPFQYISVVRDGRPELLSDEPFDALEPYRG